ncbi:Ubiquitin carboxyl-terminal hydrolase 36 [Rhizopus stolonifer]|uniref:ubiquitinyl hydrolase 1 n=1 Tax=Rhizopus stolonifer TaxID=4846 RepID=A0A367IUK4_RHIST|nr:Ubiquitin carboxyl-terminal hydrolase 36 [Rhizopus stolonifer]
MSTKGQQRAEAVLKGEKTTPLSQKNTINNLLHRAIKFRKSRYVDHKLDQFKQKFAPINGVSGVVHASSAYELTGEQVADQVDPNGFEIPAKVLFSKDRLNPGWQQIHPMGPGLKDMGHLSSLNAVLQVLTYTPALANYLLERTHSANCTLQDYCFVCAVEEHVRTALKGSSYPLQPRIFVGKLKKMSAGSTSKDAFDVWKYFMEQIQSFLLSEKTSKDKRVHETTALYQMFGGHIQKRLQCSACNKEDNHYDSFLYLSTSIAQGNQAERSLSKHFKQPVSLSRECPSCQHEGECKGKQTIYRVPMNLVIQLKRFNADGSKITKHIQFEEKLDIQHVVTEKEKSVDYSLYAVIVHTGQTIHDGHFKAYVKSPSGIWYCMDNEAVQVVSVNRLLQENAYMLFYHIPPTKLQKQPTTQPVEISMERSIETSVERVELELEEESEEESEEEEESKDVQVSTKVKVENKAAIVVQHNEQMQSKRDKLGALIEKEVNESKSAEVKQLLLAKTDNQFQDQIDTWEDTGLVEKRNQTLKQIKHKRKKVDAYDLDYDRGKVKKVKNKNKNDKFNKPNMFQIASDMKQQQKK